MNIKSIMRGGVLALLCGMSAVVQAQVNSYTNAGSGAWDAAANWSTGLVPTNTDAVFITNGVYVVNLTNTTSTASTLIQPTVSNLVVSSAGGGPNLLINFLDPNQTFMVGSGTAYGAVAIGNVAGQTGTLTSSNGNFSAKTVTVGSSASTTSTGNWNIFGGTNTIRGTDPTTGGGLTLGYAGAAQGNVLLQGGVLDASASGIALGYYGTGNLTVSNGTLKASNILLGSGGAYTQTYNIFGGTNSATGTLFIGHASTSIGRVLLNGGVLNTTNTYVGNNATGTLTLSNGLFNTGTLDVGVASGSSGALNMSGGTSTVTSAFYLGDAAGATGNLLLNGGVLNAVGIVDNIGRSGTGTLTMSNGLFNAGTIELAVNAGSRGALNIYGGTNIIGYSLYVGFGSTGNMTVARSSLVEMAGGGLVSVGAGSTLTNRDGGMIQFDLNPLSFTVGSGGSFVVTNATIAFKGFTGANVGLVTNNTAGVTVQAGSHLRLDSAGNAAGIGGFTVDGAGVGNYAQLELMGANPTWQSAALNVGAGGTLRVTNASGARVNATVTNAGTISVVNGSVIYGSNVVNLGSYVSSSSTNTFNGNLTVGTNGTVTAGDIYAMGGNFVMQSTNRAFNMSAAQVVFATNGYGIATTTANHTLNLTNSGAVDMGSNGFMNAVQLATNFSIGTLSISLSNNLTVTGTKSGGLTNALYVGWLDLSTWNTNAASLSTTLSNALTLSDINLYYDAGDSRNAYLQDASYALWGGGGLLIPIPEPNALSLVFMAGFFSILLLRRRGKQV